MNRPDCAFGYAQARLQARLGTRPTPTDWHRLSASRDLATLLAATATTSLAGWTAGLDARTQVHDLERRIRVNWMEQVAEIARWQPRAWQPAILWLRWLPWLPALAKLARGGRAPDWTRSDPVIGSVIAADPRSRAAQLLRTPLAPVAAALGAKGDVAAAWTRHWQGLWPAGPSRAGLAAILREVAAFRSALEAAAPGATVEERRERLVRRLLKAFRRNPLSPVATVAWLALAALDLAQLRGAMAVRALQAPPQEAAA